MENQDIKRNIKLGVFVLGGVIIFLGYIFYLGREGNLFNKTFAVSAIFKNVEGLKGGDNLVADQSIRPDKSSCVFLQKFILLVF